MSPSLTRGSDNMRPERTSCWRIIMRPLWAAMGWYAKSTLMMEYIQIQRAISRWRRWLNGPSKNDSADGFQLVAGTLYLQDRFGAFKVSRGGRVVAGHQDREGRSRSP